MTKQAIVTSYFESTAGFWREIYEQDDLGSQIYQARYRTVLEQVDQLQLPRDARVLEVGCGAGHTTVSLAQRGFVVEALDVAQAMADSTRQRIAEAGLANRVHSGIGDIYHLPYPAREFALVLAIGVLPWLEDRERAVKELSRVVVPGGHVLLTMDNSRSLSRCLDPTLNPLLLPLKRCVAGALARTGLRPHAAQANFCPNAEIDRTVARHGLRKAWSSTVGFGPFTFFNLPLLRGPAGSRLQGRLQTMADQNSPWIRDLGSHYLLLASRDRS